MSILIPSVGFSLIMAIAADLYSLQEIDLAIDKRKSRLEEIEGLLTEPETLISAREECQAREQELRQLQERQKELEWRSNELNSKARDIEKKLYSGSIRNPKELQDLQDDLAAVRRHASAEDDRLLEAMMQVDAAYQELRDAKARLEREEAEWSERRAALLAEKSQLEGEVAGMESQRGKSATGVEHETLKLYDTLRVRRQGVAVAKVEMGMCQGCRITLPMSVLQKARSGLSLVQCVSCERILYMS
ncbi:MAG TPA: hypothetical protein VNL15_01770 [Dehalococcoidia bacterium]|nr:hypothetical protein [Dehalococcoidia bacterium]